MGMAASQARLLTITARIHDVEYQAQSIQNAKVQLATQSDQAYNEYLEALDATTLTVKAIDNGEKITVPANFSTLFSRDRVNVSNGLNFSLVTDRNELVVEPEIYEDYKEFVQKVNSNDPYEFAMFVLGENAIDYKGQDLSAALREAEIFAYEGEPEKSSKLTKLHEKLENLVGNDIYNSNGIAKDDKKMEEYEQTMAAYKRQLYTELADDIFKTAADDSEAELDQNLMNYYADIFRQIKAHNGCVPISDYDGMAGDAAHDCEWLQSMIQCGKFSIESYKIDDKTGEVLLEGVSPSSDSALEYTPTTTIDKKAAAKAEAEYEHKLKEIDQKDKRFDLSLSKLETERNALTTEYDSVKKVIEDNIDRTFGIFS